MSKHARRPDAIREGGRISPAGSGIQVAGEAPPAGEGTANPEGVGKYWVVIVLWTIGFASLIAFELIAAIFRR